VQGVKDRLQDLARRAHDTVSIGAAMRASSSAARRIHFDNAVRLRDRTQPRAEV
jgi:hypothetical protein